MEVFLFCWSKQDKKLSDFGIPFLSFSCDLFEGMAIIHIVLVMKVQFTNSFIKHSKILKSEYVEHF